MRKVLAALAVVAFVFIATPRPAADAWPGLPDPCNYAPGGGIQDACHVVEGISNPVAAAGGAIDLATGAADTAGVPIPGAGLVTDLLGQISAALADTVQGAMDGLGKTLDSAPTPPIDQDWFDEEYKPLMKAGAALCFAVFLFWAMWFGLRGHVEELGRSFRLFIAAIFFTATAPLFIRFAVDIADRLSAALINEPAGALTDKVNEVTSSIRLNEGINSVEWWAKPFFVILTLLGCVVLVLFWMVLLLVRSELLFVGTLATPFVLVAIIDGKMQFARWYFKAMFGLIIAKPVLFGTLAVGARMLQRGWAGQEGLWPLLTAIVLMAAPIVMPILVVKVLLPATAGVIAVVERGGHKVAEGVTTAAGAVVGLVAGGPAGAATGASTAAGAWTVSGEGPIEITREAEPRTPPPRRRVADWETGELAA